MLSDEVVPSQVEAVAEAEKMLKNVDEGLIEVAEVPDGADSPKRSGRPNFEKSAEISAES